MTPDEIALDVVRQLRWDNDTRWHEIIAAAIAAERAAREKAEADARDWQSIAELNARTGRELAERDEKSEAERNELRKHLTAFLYATIDEDGEPHPSTQYVFMLAPDGCIPDRAILGGQVTRARAALTTEAKP